MYVSASINDGHQLSIRRRSQQLDLSYSTIWKILWKDLFVKPFKMQLMQRIEEFMANRLLESWPKIHFFIEKLCPATNLIFSSTDT